MGLFGVGDFADTFYILYAIGVLEGPLGKGRAATWSVALYALHNVLYASWSYAGGWIADRANKRLILVVGYVCAALAALCMVVGIAGVPAAAVMFAARGQRGGALRCGGGRDRGGAPAEEFAVAEFGVLAVVTGLGDLISSVAVGCLWAAFGPRVALGCALGVDVARRVVHAASREENKPALKEPALCSSFNSFPTISPCP